VLRLRDVLSQAATPEERERITDAINDLQRTIIAAQPSEKKGILQRARNAKVRLLQKQVKELAKKQAGQRQRHRHASSDAQAVERRRARRRRPPLFRLVAPRSRRERRAKASSSMEPIPSTAPTPTGTSRGSTRRGGPSRTRRP
jgi:hypothetical protein